MAELPLSSTDMYMLRVLHRSNPDALNDELKRRGFTRVGERLKILKMLDDSVPDEDEESLLKRVSTPGHVGRVSTPTSEYVALPAALPATPTPTPASRPEDGEVLAELMSRGADVDALKRADARGDAETLGAELRRLGYVRVGERLKVQKALASFTPNDM